MGTVRAMQEIALPAPMTMMEHAFYALLVLSMLSTRMVPLRLMVIAAAAIGIFGHLIGTGNQAAAAWLAALIAVNVGQMALAAYKTRSFQFSAEEQLFRDYVIPGLSPEQAHRLTRVGAWLDVPPEKVLVRQGDLVSHMFFVASGEVEITVDGVAVGFCDRGSLVGEISIMTETPATATATAKSSVRALAFEKASLLQIMESDRDIEQALNRSIRWGLRQKLASANEALVAAESR